MSNKKKSLKTHHKKNKNKNNIKNKNKKKKKKTSKRNKGYQELENLVENAYNDFKKAQNMVDLLIEDLSYSSFPIKNQKKEDF
ncbi:hypothetical protein M0813_05421 [Anaeramoeba flamelloides]|uniref:Uncharacterized protein n=1 Tax=Anaeramoeba flamelloides TaxID=1746091 RepID=A0ABQ8XHI1_9EUKA|nr:hypothetical protein M0813_05421 [Anaeramoeba flamelloides]